MLNSSSKRLNILSDRSSTFFRKSYLFVRIVDPPPHHKVRGQRSMSDPTTADRCKVRVCWGRVYTMGHNRHSSLPLRPHPLSIHHFPGIWCYRQTGFQCLFLSQGFQLQQTKGRSRRGQKHREKHSAKATFLLQVCVIISDGWWQRRR